MKDYKISYELFLYMLSNFQKEEKPVLIGPDGEPDYYLCCLTVYDGSLIREIGSWLDSSRDGNQLFANQKIAVNIGPFLQVFPVSMKLHMTKMEECAIVTFSFDYFDRSLSGSWQDWFILPEDKYKMGVSQS